MSSKVDRFASWLDDPTVEVSPEREAQAMAALAQALQASTLARPAPSDAFRASLRQELIARAREQQATAPLLTRIRDRIEQTAERWRYSTGMAVGTGALAMALSSGGVAAAAEDALPGDVLWSVKLGFEDLRLAFTLDDRARGERELGYAADRVAEAGAAARAGRTVGAAAALVEAEAQARSGSTTLLALDDPEATAVVVAFADEQRAALAELLPLLDSDAAQAATDLMDSLGEIVAAAVRQLPEATSPSETATQAPAGGTSSPTSSESPTATSTATPAPTESPTVTSTGTPTALPVPLPSGILPEPAASEPPAEPGVLPVPLPTSPPSPPPAPAPSSPGVPVPPLQGAAEAPADSAGTGTVIDEPDGAVEDAAGAVGGAIDAATGTVSDTSSETTSTVGSVVDTTTGVAGDVERAATDTVDAVEDAVDGAVSGTTGALGT